MPPKNNLREQLQWFQKDKVWLYLFFFFLFLHRAYPLALVSSLCVLSHLPLLSVCRSQAETGCSVVLKYVLLIREQETVRVDKTTTHNTKLSLAKQKKITCASF